MQAKKENYFNTPEYLDYLIKNFDLIDSSLGRDITCQRPDINLILNYTDKLRIRGSESLLEIGCGLGRLLEFFRSHYKITPSGVDVSESAIKEAKERLPSLNQNLKCSSAEELPFKDCEFDFVLCWAVFDLTDQGKALSEMIRVLKPGGSILLTGKNNNFMDDDSEALAAEIGSRNKGIPNHYTDYKLLTEAIHKNGGNIEFEHFFLRRGDFMQGKFTETLPSNFVEYCIIIKKVNHKEAYISKIADAYSNTWRQLNG